MFIGTNESGRNNGDRDWERQRERVKEQSGRTIEITSKNFAQGVNEILDILSQVFLLFTKNSIQMVLVSAEFLSFDYP